MAAQVKVEPWGDSVQGGGGNSQLVGGKGSGLSVESFRLPNGVVLTVSARNGLAGLQPSVRGIIQGMLDAAPAAGIASINVQAGKATGHLSHAQGTEIDLKGFTADGQLWTPEQRVALAEGARAGGADRFGLYSFGEGKLGQGTLHVGSSGPGRPAAVWGADGKVRGDSSRRFTNPAEQQFLAAVQRGQPYGNGAVQVANAASGAPDAGAVPLPRISPSQRAIAQSAPPSTEAVSDNNIFAQYAEEVSPSQPPAQRAIENVMQPSPVPAQPRQAAPALDLEPARQPEGLNVRVNRGDTLWDFAAKYLGDGRRWTEISEANSGIAPEKLMPGMVLNIPGVEGPPTPQARPNPEAVKGAEPRQRAVAPAATQVPAAPKQAPAPAPAPAIAMPAAPARQAAPAPTPAPEEPEFDIDAMTRIDEDENYTPSSSRQAFVATPPERPIPTNEARPAAPPPSLEEVLRERSADGQVQTTITDAARTGAPTPIQEVAPSPSRRAAVGVPAGSASSHEVARDEQKKRQMMENALQPQGSARVAAGTPEAPKEERGPWRSVMDNPVTNWASETVFGPDSAFHGLTLAPESATANVPAPLDIAPAPRKDQSRIDPSAPSQRQPATRQPSSVDAPRDMVNEAPFDPAAFRGGRNPPGVQNPTISGTGVTYRHNGWSVQSHGSGIATRARSADGQVTLQTWNPTNNSWMTTSTVPAATSTAPATTTKPATKTQPVQATGNSGWMNSPGLSTHF